MAQARHLITLVGAIAEPPEAIPTPTGRDRVIVTLAGHQSLPISHNRFRHVSWRHRVSVVGYRAEHVAKLPIGSPLYIEGTLRSKNYELPDGTRRARVDVYAHTVESIDYPNELEYDQAHRPHLADALNHVVLSGNLTRDVTHRTTRYGATLTFGILAVNVPNENRSSEAPTAHFIPFSMWDDLAERHADLRKSDSVFIHGVFLNHDQSDEHGPPNVVHATQAFAFERLVPADPHGRPHDPDRYRFDDDLDLNQDDIE